ncbi:MAG: UvrD-helicase domain-containing protein [Erysipelotrichia bacterium]|nr:UvrD-helicase domain-containing protein [Erysipelotrichia bacterium]
MNFDLDLNEKQLEAVTTSSQHVRIIAGAGSGKTRVLTYRIAYLVSALSVPPWKILAITFTNKVAKEMKERIAKLLPNDSKDLTIRTFHSFAAYFLRQEIDVLGFPRTFTIIDEEDQLKLIKDVSVELGYRKSDEIIKKAVSFISRCKLKEEYPSDVKLSSYEHFANEKECLKIYEAYESHKDKMFALDFDDLLLFANKILAAYPDIRIKWQNKIDEILIDEFQDTNDTEYRLINYLKKPSTSLYVVGDPDQTIYTWRGANQKIILDLGKRFPDIVTIVLERNYRSTQKILDSANKLIGHNKLRVAKNLYTENYSGPPIVVKASYSSKDEAMYVAREIKRLKTVENKSYAEIAILYRSNYITIDFEQAFVSLNIPYRIYGGQKFYQRREIKDVLAYFHLIVNTKDDISFARISNVPKRNIGETSLNLLKVEAKENQKSLYDFIHDIEDKEKTALPNRVINPLKTMIARIDIARIDIAKQEEVFSKILENMIIDLGYYDYLAKEDDGAERLENIKALFNDIRTYLHQNPESSFEEYLQNIALISAQDEIIDGEYVTMMTAHTAKGLEFPIVFVVRLNDGVFPHIRALLDGGYQALEEERRLAYVAFTRAKEKLYLSFAGGFSYVIKSEFRPSQFIVESGNAAKDPSGSSYVPQNIRQPQVYHFDDGPNSDFTSDTNEPFLKQEIDNGIEEWNVGEIVIHRTLGKGVILELEGDDIIKVDFKDHGIKSILGNHPAISKGGKA